MNHPINMDAIQAGVEAFLETYPDEAALDARSPTSGPRGAHAVLWVDDFWRGVDMAREALMAAVLQPERVRALRAPDQILRRVACAAAAYSLTNEGRPMDYQVALCSLDGRHDVDDMDIEADAVDVFVEQIASIYATGDADDPGHGGADGGGDDPELKADLSEPA